MKQTCMYNHSRCFSYAEAGRRYLPARRFEEKGGISNSRQLTDELKEECLRNLPTRDVPLQYYVRTDLPLSGVGKVDYRALEGVAKGMTDG